MKKKKGEIRQPACPHCRHCLQSRTELNSIKLIISHPSLEKNMLIYLSNQKNDFHLFKSKSDGNEQLPDGLEFDIYCPRCYEKLLLSEDQQCPKCHSKIFGVLETNGENITHFVKICSRRGCSWHQEEKFDDTLHTSNPLSLILMKRPSNNVKNFTIK